MANKRVIDLATLSETVQEGQYVLVDSSGGTGKMDLKHIVDEAGTFDPAGEYPELFAGNLTTDKAQTDKTPYLFRKTAGNLSRVGERCYDTIVGASVGENQLVQSGATSVTVQSGHKYYAKINGTESLGVSTGSAITINDSSKDMVIDLTQMLGSAIADYVYSLGSNGIAKLREWGFLRGYQAFNAGAIESVEVTGKKVVGFNQFDKDTMTVNGEYIIDSTGEAAVGSIYKRTDYIPVIGGKTYYVKTEQTNGGWGAWYDADKNYISGCTGYYATPLQTAPANARYIRLTIAASRGGSADTFCINLSSDRNGEYEAYASQSYDYGDDVLRGIFKLDSNNELYADGDRKEADGTIIRKYGVVDLGTLDYTYQSAQTRFYSTGLAGVAKGAPSNESANAICQKYEVSFVPDSTTKTGVFAIASTTGNLFIKDTVYTDATVLKNSLSGVYLVYELATPTTEQSTPFTSPQVCYPDGTEEYVTSNNVPVGHETEYPYDLKGLVEGLIDVPDVPSSNGTYVLKATRSASGVAYNWVTG